MWMGFGVTLSQILPNLAPASHRRSYGNAFCTKRQRQNCSCVAALSVVRSTASARNLSRYDRGEHDQCDQSDTAPGRLLRTHSRPSVAERWGNGNSEGNVPRKCIVRGSRVSLLLTFSLPSQAHLCCDLPPAFRIIRSGHGVVVGQPVICTILLRRQSVRELEVPFECLLLSTTYHADDVIGLH